MRYRLATYRECKAHREWNTTCPDCGRKGKFSPYIDTVAMQPVDDKRCGRCNRLSNCGYHLPPREVARPQTRKRDSLMPTNQPSEQRCDDGSFISPKENRQAVYGVELFYSRMLRSMNQSQP